MGHRLQQRFRKLHFVMRKKKWRQQIVDLGRQIDRVGKLFGEAEALAPARQSRSSRTHQAFGNVRSQASSLHKAITDAFACACDTPHAFKLVMAKAPKIPTSWPGANPPSRILKVSFPLCSRAWAMPRTVLKKQDAWCSFDTTMVSPPETSRPLLSNSSFGGSRSSISSSSRGGQSSLPSRGSISTRTDATTPLLSASPGCASYLETPLTDPLDTFITSLFTASGRPIPIRDLCGTLRTETGSLTTGYLDDGRGSYHILSTDPEFSFTSAEIRHVISLKAILTNQDPALEDETTRAGALPRRQRMSIALTLAYALLELYPTPWMPRSVRKLDVYFFQRKDGKIMIDNPFFLCESSPPPQQQRQHQEADAAPANTTYEESVDDSNALLVLGIVIMELWFGQTIESRSFYRDHSDETGKEKAFTSFTAALEWQKKTIDEAGVTLHDITNRCIRGNFGEPTMDFGNGSCVKAVHDQVVKPLEGMLGYIWPVKGAV